MKTKNMNASVVVLKLVLTLVAFTSSYLAFSMTVSDLKSAIESKQIEEFQVVSANEDQPFDFAAEGEDSVTAVYEIDPGTLRGLEQFKSVAALPPVKEKKSTPAFPFFGVASGYPAGNFFAGIGTKYLVAEVGFSFGYVVDREKWGTPVYKTMQTTVNGPREKTNEVDYYETTGASSLGYALRVRLLGGRLEAGVRAQNMLLTKDTKSEYANQFKKVGYDVKLNVIQIKDIYGSDSDMKIFILISGLNPKSDFPNQIRLGAHWDLRGGL
jgi:hypothetical protein